MTYPISDSAHGAPRRSGEFRLLLGGQFVSELGSQVSIVALPLVALLALGASPMSVAVVSAAGFAPYLIVGLPMGALVDRAEPRALLIRSDLIRFVATAAIPVLSWLGVLSVTALVFAALIVGTASVCFDITYQRYVVWLVTRAAVGSANARLEAARGLAQVGGPGVAGIAVGRLGAAAAMWLDAASFVVSAATLALLPRAPRPVAARSSMRADVREGLRFVRRHRVLGPALVSYVISAIGIGMFQATVIVFMVHVAGLTAGEIGVAFLVGNLGFVAGALVAPRIGRRFGPVPATRFALAIQPAGMLIAAESRPPVALPVLMVGLLVATAATAIYNVSFVTMRQRITPAHLLGRVTSVARTFGRGSAPLGALAGGAIATWWGARTALVVAAAVGGVALATSAFADAEIPGRRVSSDSGAGAGSRSD